MVDEVMMRSGLGVDPKIIALAASCEVAEAAIDREGGRRLGQLVVTLAEAFEAHGEADPLFGGLEDDEGGGLATAHLLDQIVVHDHLGHAAVRQAADETGATDVDLVDFEA